MDFFCLQIRFKYFVLKRDHKRGLAIPFFIWPILCCLPQVLNNVCCSLDAIAQSSLLPWYCYNKTYFFASQLKYLWLLLHPGPTVLDTGKRRKYSMENFGYYVLVSGRCVIHWISGQVENDASMEILRKKLSLMILQKRSWSGPRNWIEQWYCFPY